MPDQNLTPDEAKEVLRRYQAAGATPDQLHEAVTHLIPQDEQGNSTPIDQLGEAWGAIKSLVTGPLMMASHVGEAMGGHPGNMLRDAKAMVGAQGEQFMAAKKALGEGHLSEAAGHAVAGAIPVIGPMAANVGADIGSGHYGRAGVNAAALLAPPLNEMAGRVPSAAMAKGAIRVARGVSEAIGTPLEYAGRHPGVSAGMSAGGVIGGLTTGHPDVATASLGALAAIPIAKKVGGAMRRWGAEPSELAFKQDFGNKLVGFPTTAQRKIYANGVLLDEDLSPSLKLHVKKALNQLDMDAQEETDAGAQTPEQLATARKAKDEIASAKAQEQANKMLVKERNTKASALRIAQDKQGLEAQPPSVRETVSAPGEGGSRQSSTTVYKTPKEEVSPYTPAELEVLRRAEASPQATIRAGGRSPVTTTPVQVAPGAIPDTSVNSLTPVGAPRVTLAPEPKIPFTPTTSKAINARNVGEGPLSPNDKEFIGIPADVRVIRGRPDIVKRVEQARASRATTNHANAVSDKLYREHVAAEVAAGRMTPMDAELALRNRIKEPD